MRTISEYKFEQGPIRPPSESESLLIRITRNCPWNQCTFCPVYKNKKFSIRPLEHILKDINAIGFYVNKIKNNIEKTGSISSKRISHLLTGMNDENMEVFYVALNFVRNGMKAIFLQDGNSLIINPKDMIKILNHIKKTFPKVIRITTYARSHTIAKMSNYNLNLIATAGLNRIHVGMESGSDKVLKFINKGVDKATQILAGQKVKQAKIQLSEYYMPGLGGKILSEENAIETADALNQIKPDFVRLRTLAIRKFTSLSDQFENGKFSKMGEIDTVKEIRRFLEHLNLINSSIKSDHILNLLTEVEGILPQDIKKIFNYIDMFLNLNPQEKMIFCIGRRTGRITRLAELKNSIKYKNSLQLCIKLGITPDNMDEKIDLLIQNFL